MENLGKYIGLLKQYKLKNTVQRCAVLKVLDIKNRPLSIEEIYKFLIQEDVSINLSTVFRILESFVKVGITNKISVGQEQRSLYEWSRGGHKHYFFCIGCREMFAIDACPIKLFEDAVKEHLQCQITGHKFELSGYCMACSLKEENPSL